MKPKTRRKLYRHKRSSKKKGGMYYPSAPTKILFSDRFLENASRPESFLNDNSQHKTLARYHFDTNILFVTGYENIATIDFEIILKKNWYENDNDTDKVLVLGPTSPSVPIDPTIEGPKYIIFQNNNEQESKNINIKDYYKIYPGGPTAPGSTESDESSNRNCILVFIKQAALEKSTIAIQNETFEFHSQLILKNVPGNIQPDLKIIYLNVNSNLDYDDANIQWWKDLFEKSYNEKIDVLMGFFNSYFKKEYILYSTFINSVDINKIINRINSKYSSIVKIINWYLQNQKSSINPDFFTTTQSIKWIPQQNISDPQIIDYNENKTQFQITLMNENNFKKLEILEKKTKIKEDVTLYKFIITNNILLTQIAINIFNTRRINTTSIWLPISNEDLNRYNDIINDNIIWNTYFKLTRYLNCTERNNNEYIFDSFTFIIDKITEIYNNMEDQYQNQYQNLETIFTKLKETMISNKKEYSTLSVPLPVRQVVVLGQVGPSTIIPLIKRTEFKLKENEWKYELYILKYELLQNNSIQLVLKLDNEEWYIDLTPPTNTTDEYRSLEIANNVLPPPPNKYDPEYQKERETAFWKPWTMRQSGKSNLKEVSPPINFKKDFQTWRYITYK